MGSYEGERFAKKRLERKIWAYIRMKGWQSLKKSAALADETRKFHKVFEQFG